MPRDLALPIEWLPAAGAPEQLILLLHGGASDGTAMAPLAQALRAEFPQAAVLAPDAPQPAEADDGEREAPAAVCRQWYDPQADIAEACSAALPALHRWVQQMQQRHRVGPAATALGGFSQGATLALAAAVAHDGLAGRVLAYGGRFPVLPDTAPRHTTVHLLHGGADTVMPAEHARQALQVLGALNGDATLDIAEGVGHALHPALIQRALFRLRNHIPARTWAAALGAVPPGSC